MLLNIVSKTNMHYSTHRKVNIILLVIIWSHILIPENMYGRANREVLHMGVQFNSSYIHHDDNDDYGGEVA